MENSTRIAFGQTAVTLGSDGRMVDEYVLATLMLDEAEAFLVIEPLNGAGNSFFTHVGKLLVLEILLKFDRYKTSVFPTDK